MPVTVAVPGATPVKAAVQLPDTRVQLAATVPTEVSDETKLTLPVGVFDGVVVSATVAVQVDSAPGKTVEGLQAKLVEVLSFGAWLANVAVCTFSVSKPPPPLATKTQVSPAAVELLEPAQAPTPRGVVTT